MTTPSDDLFGRTVRTTGLLLVVALSFLALTSALAVGTTRLVVAPKASTTAPASTDASSSPATPTGASTARPST